MANNYYKEIFVQFWLYLKGLVWHHNLGYSYKMNQGVDHGHLPSGSRRRLVLVGISTLLALIVAVPLGILPGRPAQQARGLRPDRRSFVLYAMPPFLLGTLLILYFAIDIHVFSVEAPQGQTVAPSSPTRAASSCPRSRWPPSPSPRSAGTCGPR